MVVSYITKAKLLKQLITILEIPIVTQYGKSQQQMKQ